MRLRRLTLAMAPLALAGALAGCGGGGDTAADTPAADPVASSGADFTSQGVSASASASQAAAILGAPAAVDPSQIGESVGGYDRFGTPKDVFEQQVRDEAAGGTNGAEAAPGSVVPTTTAVPVVSPPGTVVPSISVGGSTATGTTPAGSAAPGPTGVPTGGVTIPNGLEADFDISGEPVVAREGDSIPPDTQQFTVKTIKAKSVILQLNAGLLPNGRDTVALDEGESVTLVNQTQRQKYRIRLIDVRSVN